MHTLNELKQFLESKEIKIKFYNGWKMIVGKDTWGMAHDILYCNSEPVHKKEVLYRFGRHWPNITANDMAIFWYGWSPWTEQTKKRKHQIQFRIPEVDIHRGFGSHHHAIPQVALFRPTAQSPVA